jgi:hypothetical protein
MLGCGLAVVLRKMGLMVRLGIYLRVNGKGELRDGKV